MTNQKLIFTACASLFLLHPALNAQSEVKIGKQTWMATNLNVAVFANGDSIPQAKSDSEWLAAGRLKKPAWSYYQNDIGIGA